MSETSSIVLAGGCFWGVEHLFADLPGVVNTSVGYIGGSEETATYEHVKTGTSGHAEAVNIVYDPAQTSLESILDFFFKIHDPTTLNQQGNDRGTQYRSAIFTSSPEQEACAAAAIEKEKKGTRWGSKIVTTIERGKVYYPAEEYHQDYLKKNPGGYNCHFIRD